jgi:hypothetical protein
MLPQARRMTHPHCPTLAQARTHWRQHDWSALNQIDVDAITSAEHRAKLALCAAVGLVRQDQTSAAMQALERALDWGIAPEITAYLASRGVLSALSKPPPSPSATSASSSCSTPSRCCAASASAPVPTASQTTSSSSSTRPSSKP